MTHSQLKTHCLAKPGAYLEYTFGPDVEIIKVKAPSQEKGMIFAMLFNLRGEPKITLKCDMQHGEFYRSIFPGTVTRGYHCPPVQQPYFNTITLNDIVPDDTLVEMIAHAYTVTVSKFPKKYQHELREVPIV